MKTTVYPGDRFKTKDGWGMVLPDNKVIIISGQGGRSGYRVKKTAVPADVARITATPPHEVTFALDVVAYSYELGIFR